MRLCLYMVCVAAVSVAAACEPMRSSSRAEPEDEASEEAVSRAEYDESERTQQRTGKTREVEPLPEEQRADAPLDTPRAPLRADAGVFSDLDGRVSFPFPAWLGGQGIIVGKRPGGGHLFAMLDGRAIGFGHADMGELKLVENTSANDADGDGIPNQLDIVIGAEKAALNAAPYQGGYKGMSYPGGDVPRTEGVCTDVLVRAIRNAGIDLQKELHEDIQAKPSAYHMVETPDPNIDQRRVRTLLPYFERRWQARPTDTDALTSWLPGDVVFMNTMGDDRPDHVGIVSSRQGDSGLPLIINNWTNGYHTKAMDLLSFVPVTHRFRLPADDVQWSPATRLDDALAQHGVSLEEAREQAILVLAESEGPMAKLQRFERGELAHWRVVSDPMEARIGGRGLGPGTRSRDACQNESAPESRGGPPSTRWIVRAGIRLRIASQAVRGRVALASGR